VTIEVLADTGGTPVEHPSYISDLDPTDVWAFPTLINKI
jgi:hypothetical protein